VFRLWALDFETSFLKIRALGHLAVVQIRFFLGAEIEAIEP
jgi:hypothetical protein